MGESRAVHKAGAWPDREAGLSINLDRERFNVTSKSLFHRRLRLSAIAGAVSMALFAGYAHAQTNITGNVYGTVAPASGQTILVENVNTGFKRTLTPDASGRFSLTALPAGTYKVSLLRDGKVVSVNESVEVLIGQGTEVAFAMPGTQTVTVTGRAVRLDMTSTTGGSNFTSTQLDALPVGKGIDAIVLLAPNTTRADPRYANNATSIGGGAPSENAFYINGFPVTNALNQLGSSQLPFGAIGQAQVLTGGYGAEFGRSTGGVVNIITKSGTNTWQGGVSYSISPQEMRSKYKDIYYPQTGANPRSDGTLYLKRADNTREVSTYSGYVSGPIIEDKLVMFLAAEQTRDNRGTVALTSASASTAARSGWADRGNINNRYLAKFDWNLTGDHLVEATLIGDRYTMNETLSGYNYTTGAKNGVPVMSASYLNNDDNNLGVGSSAQIVRYTGFWTKDLTVSALIGQSKSPHATTFSGVDVNSNTLRQVAIPNPTNSMPGVTYTSPYPFPAGTFVVPAGSNDKTEAQRIDVEYKLTPSHTIRAGIDKVSLKSAGAGDRYAGGGVWSYFSTTDGSFVPAGMTTSLIAAGATPINGRYYYARDQIFLTVTDARSDQSAQYIEDNWQVTKNLKVTPGLRIEQYKNINGDGETFLKVDNQINPRLSFTWDVNGDGRTKVYGSAGRYGVQIPTHLAVRGASRSTFTRQFFTYTGVDANGAPIGGVSLGDPYSSNNEYGQAKDAKTVSAQDMKPNSQDEFRIGIERALANDINVGAALTYRRLVNTIDDLCDPRPFEKYAFDNAIDTTNWGGFGCASFNPGRANTFLIDYAGNGTYRSVTLSAADLQFPKPKRTYFALDFFAEHPLRNGWYGKITYTYSKNKGNTEGQTLSDVGQTDVAATQTWDTPELMYGAYGYLPNDRRHQIKAYGFVRVKPEIDIGANLLLASGRPKNCIGNFGGTPANFPGADHTFDDVDYGSSYRYCTVNGVTSAAPRGSEGNLPWEKTLDLNVTFRPASVKGLTLRADIFNVFNTQTVTAVDEVHEAAYDPSTITATYGRALGYTPPRAIRLTASYEF